MIKRVGGICHTGDCLRDFWIKTVWDDVSVVFPVEGMGRIEYRHIG